MEQIATHNQLWQKKLAALIAVLAERPALRDWEMGEGSCIGYLLDKCGMDRSAQSHFAFQIQNRCGGELATVAIQNFGDLTLGQIANILARTDPISDQIERFGEVRKGYQSSVP